MSHTVMEAQASEMLDRHAENHGGISLTCPVCVRMTVDATIVVGNDGIGRSIEQAKAQRTITGYEPGTVTAKDRAHFQRVCPHPGVFRGETCPQCEVYVQ